MVSEAATLNRDQAPTPASGSTDDASGSGWRRLPDAALRTWHVDNLLGLVAALAALGVCGALGHPRVVQPWLVPAAVLVVIGAAIESFLVLPRAHRRYRFRIEPDLLTVESGALVRRQLVVPLRQVLYVETHQGPVLRAYGLCRTSLGTIADLRSVGPLDPEAAAALRISVEATAARPGRQDRS